MQDFNPQAYFFKIDSTLKSIRLYIQKSLKSEGLELTIDQWVVLDKIYANQGVTQQVLSDITYKDPSTVSRIINLLEAKGVLIRKADSEDRRKLGIHVSPKGEGIFKKANEIVSKARKEIWDGLNQDDFERLVLIMDKIYGNVNSAEVLVE